MASTGRVLVGTAKGLHEVGAETRVRLDGRAVTALAREKASWWALVDGGAVWRARGGGPWAEVARVDGAAATCLTPTPAGLLVGTQGAHLLRLDGSALVPLPAFDAVDGRESWYTPWGDPPDTRSLSADASGTIFVNVHVGGVVRSTDHGRSWRPTLAIEADVHQVLAHPTRPDLVTAAAAVGCGLSVDGGESWTFATDGLHARYARAVAIADDLVFLTVSTGPAGRRAALYRRPLADGVAFERCRHGLPEWFTANIDTACLASVGTTVAFGAGDGSVYCSTDRGESWTRVASGLPEILCVAVG